MCDMRASTHVNIMSYRQKNHRRAAVEEACDTLVADTRGADETNGEGREKGHGQVGLGRTK